MDGQVKQFFSTLFSVAPVNRNKQIDNFHNEWQR